MLGSYYRYPLFFVQFKSIHFWHSNIYNARSYRSGLKLDNANKGSLYELTSNPFICKIMSKVEVISGSSSTIRIFLELLEPLLLLSAAAIPRKKHPIDIGASVLYIIIMMLLLLMYSSSFSFVFF